MDEGLSIQGELDSSKESMILTFRMPKTYYLGIGFNSTMKYAPMVVAIDEKADGITKPIIKDLYSVKHGFPPENSENIYKMTEATFKNESWVISLERPLF